MITFHLILEAIDVQGKYEEKEKKWRVLVRNNQSGNDLVYWADSDEVVATIALALHVDGTPVNEEFTEKCYELIGARFDAVDTELRPIP